ncbi:glycosyltransferase family 2 protein [Candidatus Uhrbacteria bacterium]|nr:glycosyltransferase family 2 protein [Candidatus Uhrbacteria bacterium]
MDLSIVIVSWNVKEKLRECLRSVEETTPPPSSSPIKGEEIIGNSPPSVGGARGGGSLTYEVFVVDNASKDGTVQMVEQEFPSVHVIANDFNAGFAKANNQAIRLSQGRYVLLLNPDMRVFQGTLEGMVRFMDDPVNAKVGVAGCWLVSPIHNPPPPSLTLREGDRAVPPLRVRGGRGSYEIDDYVTVPHVRRFPTIKDQLAIMLKVPHFFPKVLDHYMMQDFDYSKEARVDSIRGSFFMIRRELLDKIGMLDEGFFIWFEEVDFCKRAIEAGYEVAYTPTVKAVDYVGQSFKQVRLYPKQKMMTRSMVQYFRKHRPWWEGELLDWVRPLALAAVWVGDKLNMQGKRVT